MKTYSVQIPVTGSVVVTLEAESPEQAKELAWERAEFRVVCDKSDECEPGDFETHKRVTYGNVCSAVCNEINVEEV